MDTPHGRTTVPAPSRRLHGGDRRGLDDKGWAEVQDDAIGDPADTNVEPVFHEPIEHADKANDDR